MRSPMASRDYLFIYIYIYSYKIYILNKYVKRGDKLALCTLIRYLVSYNLTNIYNI